MPKLTGTLLLAGLLLAGLASPAHAADLMAVYKQALQNDPQIKQAEAAYNAARQQHPEARGALLPQLVLTGNYNRLKQSYKKYQINAPGFGGTNPSDYNGTYPSYSYGLELQQALFDAPAFAQLRQADASIGKAEAQYSYAQQQLILRTAQAYFGLLSARDNLRFAQVEKKAIGQQLKQAEHQYKVGVIANTGVQEARARYDQASAQVISARHKVDTAREQIREIIGSLPQSLTPLGQNVPLMPPRPDSADKWVAQAMKNNLQLMAANFQLKAAKDQVSVRRDKRLPKIQLVGSIKRDSSESPFLNSTSNDAVVGVQLNMPLFTGGSMTSSIHQARYQETQAQQQVVQQQRATERSTRDTFQGVNSDISEVKALRQTVKSARTALAATKSGHEVGTRTMVDVLNARQDLYKAQRDYANARYQYILDRLKLKLSTGELTRQDLEQINNWLK
ncbi:MAG TPA: TolC family outer membrane protein [Gammaproteobacteria bacterium]|nr:TolC family outer membrane protein [Gammaproteobacteria bacterium]